MVGPWEDLHSDQVESQLMRHYPDLVVLGPTGRQRWNAEGMPSRFGSSRFSSAVSVKRLGISDMGANQSAAKKGTNGATAITYTYTDEAPMLATHAFYPIIEAFCKQAEIPVQLRDISVAGRVISQFPECLTEEQRKQSLSALTPPQEVDQLAMLGEMAKGGSANIIKLPNVSASLPQLKECIAELQQKGYEIPSYPEEPKDAAWQALEA